jgi:hypothetical protein
MELYTLLTLIFTGITSISVIYLRKSYKANKPIITSFVQNPIDSSVILTIVNNAPYNISITDIYIRKKLLLWIYGSKHQVKWDYPKESNTTPRTFIEKQEVYTIRSIPVTFARSAYKVIAVTSVGKCTISVVKSPIFQMHTTQAS